MFFKMKPIVVVIWCICSIFGHAQKISNISFEADNINPDNCILNDACALKLMKNSMKAKVSVVTISGRASINQTENAEMKISSHLNIRKISASECSALENVESLTKTQLIKILTNPCRYDRLERPPILLEDGAIDVVNVVVRTYIYAMQSIEPNALKLKTHGLLQLRYVDSRLAFGKYAPNRQQPILGKAALRTLIWVPHIFFSNEQGSSILGTNEKDILTSISADGTVEISIRIQVTLYCGMNLQKFPFDEQICSTRLESWMYNSSELILRWAKDLPSGFNPHQYFKEYFIKRTWYEESITNSVESDMRQGYSSGNYSSLDFTVHLARRSDYYILEYFIPSIIIVTISWVSFWLQADQTSPRALIGTSTMLSFITLALSQDKNLPRVGYMKISEIWFLSCIIFIFGSLVEFAFANSIWRRKRNVELKKVNSKHILKSTLVHRNTYFENKSTIASSSNSEDLMDEEVDIKEINEMDPVHIWTTMTPQEVSLWIDRKAKFVFPLAFLIFNIIFWTLVYCL